jgi:hypothetical protein
MKQTANFDNVLNEVQGSMKSFKENVFFYNNHESELNIFSHSWDIVFKHPFLNYKM